MIISVVRPRYCRGCGLELDYELVDVSHDPRTGRVNKQKEVLNCQLNYYCKNLDHWTKGLFGWWWGGSTW